MFRATRTARLFSPVLALAFCLAPNLASAEALEPPSSTAASESVVMSTDRDLEDADHAWLISFGSIVDGLRQRFPDTFAGSSVEPGNVNVRFVGEAPLGLEPLFWALPVKVGLEGGALVSELDLEKATAAAHFAVHDLLPANTPIATNSDAETGTVLVEYAEAPGIDYDLLATAAKQSVVTLPGAPNRTIIELRHYENMTAADEVSYGNPGGIKLKYIDGTDNYCTSAFVVKSRANTDLGVITAGHCPPSLSQNGKYIFDPRLGFDNSNGDVRWMRSPQMMDAWFHADYNVGQPVRRIVVAQQNEDVCKFGRTSGRDCGVVDSVRACLQDTCGLVSTTYKISEGGDSGGPWYRNDSVFGSHVGSSYTPFTSHSYYMPIKTTLSKLNLNLCIDVNGSPSC